MHGPLHVMYYLVLCGFFNVSFLLNIYSFSFFLDCISTLTLFALQLFIWKIGQSSNVYIIEFSMSLCNPITVIQEFSMYGNKNIRKPLVFGRFQGVWKCDTGLKWVKQLETGTVSLNSLLRIFLHALFYTKRDLRKGARIKSNGTVKHGHRNCL